MTRTTLGIFLSGLLLGLPIGCGSNQVGIGEQNVDGQAPGADTAVAGNSGSSQGGATASNTQVGGSTASTGSTVAGGTTAVASTTKVGGSTSGTGTTAVGGATSATGDSCTSTASPGGSTGGGGSSGTGNRCGGYAGLNCAPGAFCEITALHISDAMGICVVIPEVCDDIYQPVCGADGKTYSNECEAHRRSVSKISNGVCPTPDAGAGGSGGSTRTGGTTASGGTTARGGSTGTGGTSGTTCGGVAGLKCATNQYCRFPSDTCGVFDAMGTCALKPDGCIAAVIPVCGCDGKTYNNECEAARVGISKKYDGECGSADAGAKDAPIQSDASLDSNTTRYAGAYLAWQAPGGIAGTGPVIVVSGAGWADTWTNVSGFVKSTPETPPSSATKTYTLTTTQVDDLFGRLASVDFTKLPHTGTVAWECYPYLYLRLCTGCTPVKLDYKIPSELAPELESVWTWFDSLVTVAGTTNPRNYCALSAVSI